MENIAVRTESTAPRLLALFIIALVLMGIKSPDSLTLPQLWAEDGVVFFSQQYNHIAPQLFKPYAGYLHVVPRLVAWLANAFSPTRIPMVYSTATLLISSFCVAYTSKRLDAFVPWPVVLLSFYIVATGGEIFGTLTNVQWFIQFALVAACILPATDEGRWKKLAVVTLVLLASLTGPFSIFLFFTVAALHGLTWISQRAPVLARFSLFSSSATLSKPVSYPRVAALFCGGVIQAGYLLLSKTRLPSNPDLDITNLVVTTFGDVVPLHIFGQHYLTSTAWLIIFGLLFFLIATEHDKNPRERIYILAFLALAAAFSLAGTASNHLDGSMSFGFGDRYFYFVKLTFWWAICFALSSRTNTQQAAIFVIGAMMFFAIINAQPLQRRVLTDLNWREHAKSLLQPGHHEIPINPSWNLEITTKPREK